MKRFITLLTLLLLMASIPSFAQSTVYKYNFSKAFPDTGFKFGNGAHGIAVDPAGKVWVILFDGNSKDSITIAGGTKKAAIAGVHVYNPNGTEAAFSPIKTITVNGVIDTLYAGNNRGISADKNGNIVLVNNLSSPTRTGNVFRLNYKTGAGMNKVIPQTGFSLTAPAFDDLNEMFIAEVSDAAGPIRIFDNNFAFLGNVTDTGRGFSRTVAVSGSGNDVYFGGFTNNFITRFHSDNGSLGPYGKADTITKGLTVECFAWHPKTGYLWAGGGNTTSGNNKPPYTDYSFYAFKPTNMNAPVDSFKWSSSALETNDPRPRGIAFSPTGDTVYVCAFNVSLEPCVQMFIGKSGSSGVQRENGIVAENYSLAQNYPNPFNPSTQIKFTVASNVGVSLKVYDLLGKEVATLANGDFAAGSYTVDFNAKNLTTGMYFYSLTTSTGFKETKKMLLMK